MDEVKIQLFGQLIDIASGRSHTLSEQHGFREIAIFKDGVIL